MVRPIGSDLWPDVVAKKTVSLGPAMTRSGRVAYTRPCPRLDKNYSCSTPRRRVSLSLPFRSKILGKFQLQHCFDGLQFGSDEWGFEIQGFPCERNKNGWNAKGLIENKDG